MGSSEDAELVNSRTRLEAALEEREEYWHDRPADAKRRAARRLTRLIAHRASTKDIPTWLLTRRRNLQQDHELVISERASFKEKAKAMRKIVGIGLSGVLVSNTSSLPGTRSSQEGQMLVDRDADADAVAAAAAKGLGGPGVAGGADARARTPSLEVKAMEWDRAETAESLAARRELLRSQQRQIQQVRPPGRPRPRAQLDRRIHSSHALTLGRVPQPWESYGGSPIRVASGPGHFWWGGPASSGGLGSVPRPMTATAVASLADPRGWSQSQRLAHRRDTFNQLLSSREALNLGSGRNLSSVAVGDSEEWRPVLVPLGRFGPGLAH
jgi:hypothetical protein